MTADHLVHALIVATALSLVATPFARRLALAVNIVDRPGVHKSHSRTTPYLGGLAIIVAAHAGAFAGDGITSTTGRVLLVATLVGAVGLLDDSFPIQPLPRLVCQILAATMIWGAGVRFEVTGSPVADGLVSLVWMIVVTNAFNLLDNMDGLCGGTAAVALMGLAGVALASGQVALAVTALAITGGCLGFLCFNWRPSTIFMGDAGSMFLGASVGALALAVHPPGALSARIVVPLLIIGLPAVDTATVAFGRARRGISVMQGGRDHLSHRLVELGLRRRSAVCVLVGVEAVSVSLAVAAARGLVDPWLALIVAAVPFAAVWIWTTRPRVYDDPVVGLPPVARWVILAGGALVFAVSAPAALAMVRARAPLQMGAARVQAGIQHEQSGDPVAARQDFDQAAASFASARQRLRAFGVNAGRAVPVVAVNLRAATAVTEIGFNLSKLGQELTANSDLQTLRIRQGNIPIDTLTRLSPLLERLSGQLTSAYDAVHRLPHTLLVPPIRRAVNGLDAKLATAARGTRQSADAATILPGVLGSKGPRHYLLAIQNNAESRATGGLIGNFGELNVESGHISTGRFGRLQALNAPEGTDRSVAAPADYVARYAGFYPFDLWQNVNLSPDFATVGAVLTNLYPRSGGRAVDGVIGVDPVALADVLRLTGPIHVASWPTDITADNVVQVTLQGAYDALPDRERPGHVPGRRGPSCFCRHHQPRFGQPGSASAGPRPGRHRTPPPDLPD